MNKIWKSNLFRNGLLSVSVAVLTVATVTAPVAQAQSVINSVRCGTISTYATATIAKLNIQSQAMQSAFALNLQLVQSSWDLQTQAVEAIRDTADSAFSNVMNTLKELTSKENKKNAFDAYKTGILTERDHRNTDVDAAIATYREDMLATIKTHQADLTAAVNTLKTSIGAALDVAKKNCAVGGSVTTLVAAIVSSKATLLAAGIKADAKAINRAVQIIQTRINDVRKANEVYLKAALALTKTLSTAILKK